MSITSKPFTFALWLLAAAAGTFAQDSWETTSWQEEPAAVSTDATAGYEQTTPADQDATYVIKKGDTLWDLAFQFLGDPFMWQQIWQANSYISNPDLIYPGDRLLIPGRSAYGSATGESEDFYSETSQVLDETDSLKNSAADTAAFPSDSILISLMKRKDVLSESYLATVPFLWFEKDQRGNLYPGNAVVDPPPSGASYQLYSTVTFTPFTGGTFHENDTVALFSSIRIVRFNNKPANLIKRSGVAVVQKIGPKKVDALLIKMSDAISGKERVIKLPRLKPQVIDTLIEPSASISGEIFCLVEQTQSPHPFQEIILDIGSTQGVAIGDIFGIYHTDNNNPARLQVIGIIGHVGTSSSTLTMIIMKDYHIEAGDRAVLLRRAQMEIPAIEGTSESPTAH